jgi:hypothetical protein
VFGGEPLLFLAFAEDVLPAALMNSPSTLEERIVFHSVSVVYFL